MTFYVELAHGGNAEEVIAENLSKKMHFVHSYNVQPFP